MEFEEFKAKVENRAKRINRNRGHIHLSHIKKAFKAASERQSPDFTGDKGIIRTWEDEIGYWGAYIAVK